jgi:hypothetical protein
MDTFDGSRFAADLLRLAQDAADETARQVPIDLTRRIEMRLTPDGGAQRPNSARYARQKQKKYGHSIPLLRDGILQDHSLYQVIREGLDSWRIKPPIARAQVIEWLQSRGYAYWGLSQEINDFFGRALARVMNYLESRIDTYVRKTE